MPTTYRYGVHVDRPVGDVFAYVTDPVRLPAWQPSVVAVRVLPGPGSGVGTRVEETRLVLGRQLTSVWVVTRHDPVRASEVKIVYGPLRGRARYRLAPEGRGTRLSFEADVEVVALPGPLRRVGARTGQALLVADAARLRLALERPARTVGPSPAVG